MVINRSYSLQFQKCSGTATHQASRGQLEISWWLPMGTHLPWQKQRSVSSGDRPGQPRTTHRRPSPGKRSSSTQQTRQKAFETRVPASWAHDSWVSSCPTRPTSVFSAGPPRWRAWTRWTVTSWTGRGGRRRLKMTPVCQASSTSGLGRPTKNCRWIRKCPRWTISSNLLLKMLPLC